MKTQRITMMVIAFFMMTGLVAAGETESAVNMAKKELYQEIKTCFKDDINKPFNYFYQNNINRVDDRVQICFVVDHDQSLRIVRLRCDDPDARDYVKHVFKNRKLTADSVLVGKAYIVNMTLRYGAK